MKNVTNIAYRKAQIKRFNPTWSEEKIDAMFEREDPKPNSKFNFDLTELNTYFDTVMPVCETTGLRRNDVAVLKDPLVDNDIKEMLLKRLNEIPDNDVRGLSDDDLVSMLPSRYASGYAMADQYIGIARDYISSLGDVESQAAAVQAVEQAGVATVETTSNAAESAEEGA